MEEFLRRSRYPTKNIHHHHHRSKFTLDCLWWSVPGVGGILEAQSQPPLAVAPLLLQSPHPNLLPVPAHPSPRPFP